MMNFFKKLIKGNVKYTKSLLDYLTKTSIINLEFNVESINYLSWESNLSIRPPRFFKYCLEVSMNINQ